MSIPAETKELLFDFVQQWAAHVVTRPGFGTRSAAASMDNFTDKEALILGIQLAKALHRCAPKVSGAPTNAYVPIEQ